AALAAASDLYYNFLLNGGLDPQGTAAASALSTAAADGYANDGTTSIITPNKVDASGNPVHGVWIPPISGDYKGRPGYVEVVVQYNQRRSFSNLFGSGTIPVRARSVALGTSLAADMGILVLDPTAKGALNAQGGGNVSVSGTPIIVDSNNPEA